MIHVNKNDRGKILHHSFKTKEAFQLDGDCVPIFDAGVLGGLDRARSARRDHRGGCHPHLSSWISSCCSQRTSVRFDNPQYQKQCIHFPPQSFASITLNTLKVRNGHRQLHRHLDGVRGVLHQRWLPQPCPRHRIEVRLPRSHTHGVLHCLLDRI